MHNSIVILLCKLVATFFGAYFTFTARRMILLHVMFKKMQPGELFLAFSAGILRYYFWMLAALVFVNIVNVAR